MNATKPPPVSWLPLVAFPGAMIAGLLLIVAAHRRFPLPVENSVPRIVYHGNSFAVEMEVTNHTKAPVSEVVSLWIGVHRASRYTGENFTPFDHREVSVSLAPSESRHVVSEFPNTYRSLPDFAEARVLR